jgi:hypothetical protein
MSHIYTTNTIESVNSGLEYMRYSLGGHFPSKRSLDINYCIQIEHRNDGWLSRPVPAISSNTYELRQMFKLKFGGGSSISEDDRNDCTRIVWNKTVFSRFQCHGTIPSILL